jgi:hypothetical protein
MARTARRIASDRLARRRRALLHLFNNGFMFALGVAAMAAWCRGMGFF